MEEAIRRGWENFLARTEGPMSLRFVMQPLVASILAIRAGLRDAKTDQPAYLWSALTQPDSRGKLFGEGLSDVSQVLVLAVILDVIYQLIVLRGIYPLELVFTASILAILPYLLIRGPTTRIVRGIRRLKRGGQDEMR